MICLHCTYVVNSYCHWFLQRFGVNVLKSTPLRMFANYIAYKDKSFATLDAMRNGRLHCLLDGWEDASK